MAYTNKYNLPAPLLSAIENDPYEAGDSDISTTSLILPPRIYQLRKRYISEIHEDISDCIYRLIGTNTHHILERINTPGCIKERRYYGTFLGWKIGGKIDLFESFSAILSDYKVTSIWAVLNGVKPEYEQQLNVNASLMFMNGIEVDSLQIVNFLRDWSKHKAKDYGYPSCQVVVQSVKKWSVEKAEFWIRNRVKLHQSCVTIPDNELPPCTSLEVWAKPTTYAVIQKGRKSALRVLDTAEKAEQWIEDNNKGQYVETRPGENVRCMSYCDVNSKCSQYLGI